MPDRHFWHIIRKKLEALELPFRNSDWEVMSQDLDQPFDNHIKAKFGGLSESFVEDEWLSFLEKAEPHLPSSSEESIQEEDQLFSTLKGKLSMLSMPLEDGAWSKFEEASSSFVPEEMNHPHPISDERHDVPILRMEVPIMDAIIRRKLKNFSMAYQEGDWLDMLQLLETGFDQKIQSSLDNYQLPNQKSDWKLMSILLDQVYTPVRTFPWVRTLAAATIFFAFLIGGNYWIKQNDIPSSFSEWISRKATPTQLAPTPEKQLAQHNSDNGNSNSVEKILIAEGDSTPLPETQFVALAETESQNSATNIGSWDASRAPTIELINSDELSSQTAIGDAKDGKKEKQAYSQGSEEVFGNGFNPQNNYQVSKMGVLAMNELWEMQEENYPGFPILGKRKLNLWLGLYGGTAQTKAELSGPKADRRGYTTGLRALIPLNERWSVVTGIAYGKKEFKYSYGFGSFSTGMTGSLSMVDVPLLLRYEFASENELKLYLQGGAVTTLSLLEDHQIYSPNTPQNGGITSLSPFANEPTNYQQKLNTYPGNVWLSFGVARPIGDRFRVEVEPYFLQNLQRTGIEESLGTKKRLYTAGVGDDHFYEYPEKKISPSKPLGSIGTKKIRGLNPNWESQP